MMTDVTSKPKEKRLEACHKTSNENCNQNENDVFQDRYVEQKLNLFIHICMVFSFCLLTNVYLALPNLMLP